MKKLQCTDLRTNDKMSSLPFLVNIKPKSTIGLFGIVFLGFVGLKQSLYIIIVRHSQVSLLYTMCDYMCYVVMKKRTAINRNNCFQVWFLRQHT